MPTKLHDIAHARAGDKGNTSSISLIVYDKHDFAHVRKQVTAERVKSWFGDLVQGQVDRYEVPRLGALNFVLHGALRGGVTRSLAQDAHGKAYSAWLLEMEIAGTP